MEEIDDTTNCPVCYDTFDMEKIGPRILPCSHTTCERCMSELIRNDNCVVCPQCRKKYKAENGVTEFPQNKYIFKLLQGRKESPPRLFEMCKEHDRELSLYCKDSTCESKLCQLCLLESHKNHNVVDLVKEEKIKSDDLVRFLSECKSTLLSAKDEVKNRCNDSIMN